MIEKMESIYDENGIFNFSAWLKNITCWEDMDTSLIFISAEDGGISIMDNSCHHIGGGKTLEEACMDYEEVTGIIKSEWEKSTQPTIFWGNLMDAIRQQINNFIDDNRKPYAIVMGPAQEHLIKCNSFISGYFNIPANRDIPETLWGLDLIINPYVQQTPIVLAK